MEIKRITVMQYLSLRISRRKTDPKYEKAIDALSEKYVESTIEEPSSKPGLLSPEARKNKLKQEFKNSVRMDEHEKYLADSISILMSDGKRHLKQEEWDNLLKELQKAKKKINKLSYKDTLPETLYPTLGITDSGMKSIDTVARLKYRYKEYDSAIALHVLLTTLNAEEPLYWYHLGIAFQDAEMYDKAIKAYSICHIMDPENIATYIFSAECYLKQDNIKYARLEYEEAVKLVDLLDNKGPWKKHLKYIEQTIENH